jgi:hypothetical protein
MALALGRSLIKRPNFEVRICLDRFPIESILGFVRRGRIWYLSLTNGSRRPRGHCEIYHRLRDQQQMELSDCTRKRTAFAHEEMLKTRMAGLRKSSNPPELVFGVGTATPDMA